MFIKKWEAYVCFAAVIIHVLLLLTLLLLDIIDNNYASNAAAGDEHQLKLLQDEKSRYIIFYIVNNIFVIVFVIFTYIGTFKKQVSYVYTVFWFIVWLIFSIGPFFLYDGYLAVRIINISVGIACIFVFIALFYDLSQKRRVLDFERSRRKNQI